MSKNSKKRRKRLRKRFGPQTGLCLGCGTSLRRHEPACRKCGRPSAIYQPKAAAPVLVKSSGNVVPLRRPLCWAGHPGARWDRYCRQCGEPVGVSRQQSVAMAARALRGGYWGGEAMREADPGRRSVLEKMARAQPGYQGDDPDVLARALGYRDAAEGARQETSPAYRMIFERAWLGLGGGGDVA